MGYRLGFSFDYSNKYDNYVAIIQSDEAVAAPWSSDGGSSRSLPEPRLAQSTE